MANLSFLNALIKCSIDCPSMCNLPVNVQCPQCLPHCMLYEIGFGLIKWGVVIKKHVFSLSNKCFWILNPLNPEFQILCRYVKRSYFTLFELPGILLCPDDRSFPWILLNIIVSGTAVKLIQYASVDRIVCRYIMSHQLSTQFVFICFDVGK